MHVVSKKPLRKFWEKHPDAEKPLSYWFKITQKADWKDLVDTKKDFSHADLAGICTIFNIGGNKYRLITKIYYPGKKVSVRFILTHAEYSKKGYKHDCKL